MYVLVDMEWISNQRGNHWPTQLAAARVDAHWNMRQVSPMEIVRLRKSV